MQSSEAASATDTPDIPDKLYFRIGEVSRVSGVKQHVLRYWETEFPGISPKKSGSGHRLYRRKDVELILEIKRLLYEQRFTIEGARKHLGSKRGKQASAAVKATPKPAQTQLFDPGRDVLEHVRQELREIAVMLGSKR